MITWRSLKENVSFYFVCWYGIEVCLQVDMESLLATGKLSVLMVGQDILNATNEVGSYMNTWWIWKSILKTNCQVNVQRALELILYVLICSTQVGSQCTVLTDNYCEDAYDLLQNSVLKKLLVNKLIVFLVNFSISTFSTI
jgi:hypothetical protein